MALRMSQMAKSVSWHAGDKKDRIWKGQGGDAGESSFCNLYPQNINCSEVRNDLRDRDVSLFFHK